MQHLDLILTLTSGLAVALAFGYLTHRLGLSPIVGYLLAGLAVGPHTPGFTADPQLAEQMADIGVILLMFGVGLQFHLDELLAVRRVVVPGALIQSLVATTLGTLIALGFGFDWRAGIVFGLCLSVASTVVLTRVLADNRELHARTGHIAVGWLVVEDLYTVLVLVLLPAVFGSREGGTGQLLLAVGWAVVKMAALIAFAFIVGGRVIPRLLERVSATGSRELFTLTVLVIALGIAVGSSLLFGVSMALGAFLAGMVVGRSDFSLRAATEALPMRDAFAVLFFVSVGMLLDPRHFVREPGMIAAILGFVLVWKPIAAFTLMYLFRLPPRVAINVAVALAQIGEFSFILAALGRQLGILPEGATHTLVAVSIVSISLNPLLYKLVHPFEARLLRHPRFWSRLSARSKKRLLETAPASQADPKHRAILIGYGPVGRTVTRLLRENQIEPTVIEMNVDTVRKLRIDGVPAIYGDATHRDTLKAAGIETAGSLILSSAGMHGSEEIIRLARQLNPEIRVLARATYVHEVAPLLKAGAEVAFSAESEIALAMTVTILRDLGATPEQIDRERERVQAELCGFKVLPPPIAAPATS